LDRRDFLKAITGAAVLALTGRPRASIAAVASPTTARFAGVATTQAEKSVIFAVRYRKPGQVLRSTGISRRRLRDMITTGICQLTESTSLADAFKQLFSEKDIIGFKFDNTAEHVLRTNQALCEELLRLFVHNGFSPDQLMFIGATPADKTLPKTRPNPFGWTEQVDFGSGKDQLAVVLKHVTALVNVPVLRADPIIAAGPCLKNISYGFIHHPARFYANACTPYIADIYNIPLIRSKIRFHLVNAIKVLLVSDVIAIPGTAVPYETLFFSFDPLAADAHGLDVIERLRAEAKLNSLIGSSGFPHHFPVAAEKGIGRYHPDHIDPKTVRP